MTDVLNAETIKQIVTSSSVAAAKEAVRTFVQDYPYFAAAPAPKAETPTYVKWGAGIGATLVAAAILWMANTLNQLQLTVARIDERQITDTTKADVRDLQLRMAAVEKKEFKP